MKDIEEVIDMDVEVLPQKTVKDHLPQPSPSTCQSVYRQERKGTLKMLNDV